MPERVAAHRNNGRPFDEAFYIATRADQRTKLEATLIRALHPTQNRAHHTVAAIGVPAVDQDEAHADQ
jgi:hypothetical protein